jgi:hypothetical protein
MINRIFTFILSAIFIILWLFLFANKPRYIISLTKQEILNYYPYFITLHNSAMIIIIWLVITSILKGLLKHVVKESKRSNKKITVFDKILTWIMNQINKINIFSKTYTMILDFIGPKQVHKIINLAKLVLTYTNNEIRYIIISFVLIPRLIIVFTFLLEIYFGKLHYYFYSLFLLLIPLIFKFIVFMLKDIGPRILPEFQKFVILEPENTNVVIQTKEGDKVVQRYKFRLIPEASDLDLGFLLSNFYYPLLHIEGHVEQIITPIASKITLISIYIYYIIHFLGLTYIIYFIL